VPETRKPTDPPAHYLVNANSIGLRITHSKVTFSLPGDVQQEDQHHSLLKTVPKEKLRCDILIAPAHGIHADIDYAKAVQPKVVFCGVVDRFLPALKAPSIYESLGAQVFINSRHGELTVESDGNSFTVRKEREGNKTN
jgi:beta-lactamase superfamily II metal-dependent hydrolase